MSLEKLEIPGTYRKSIQNQTMIEEQDEFDGLPYKPLPNCPLCKGCGFLHPRKHSGAIDYRHIVPCAQPGCYRDQAAAYKRGEIVAHSGVIGVKQTFETFNADVKGVRRSYKAAWDIAEGLGAFIWLIIFGGVGNGKTHLLNAIANRVMERGISLRLVMMADLLSELRMAIETNKTDFKMKELKEVPYLLIDELGLEYGTEWEKEKIEELLATRWANGRFTVVATNRDIEELPERLKSRFKDRHLSKCVLNEAGDYRIMKNR